MEGSIEIFFGTRALVAVLAGIIIGVERSITLHPAGIKTIVLVSLGSSMFTSLAFYLHEIYPTSDPNRIIGQIITGIGFLCAGVIFRERGKVGGLTSSTMVWSSAALGTIAGSGLVLVPIFGAITIVCVTLLTRRIEKFIQDKENKK